MSWSYVWAHLSQVSLGCTAPQWWLALAGMAWFVYWGWRLQWPLAAVVLRAVAWTSAVAVVAGVHLRVPLPERPMTLVALVDRSASIDAVGRQWQEQYLREVDRWRSPQDKLAVITFAGRPLLARWPAVAPLPSSLPLAPEPEETNLAAALDTALALARGGGERRYIVLSDGNETQGDTRSLLPLLRAQHAAVYTAVPPRAQRTGPRIAHWQAPALAPANSPVLLRAVIDHTAEPRAATLRLWADGALASSTRTVLQRGSNAVSLVWQGGVPGAHHLRLEVDSGDGHAVARSLQLSLPAAPRILLVTRRGHSPLAAVAQAQQYELRQIDPGSVRPGQIDWDNYHLVLWEEPVGTIAAPVWAEVREYVASGGGLFVLGGERTFGDTRLRATPLADLLPVTIEPRRPPRPEREPLSMFVLVDRSNSMGYHVHERMQRSDDESKLAYARRAALALIEQLRDSDRVGVLAFDSQMYELAPLAPLADNRGLLEHNIPRLQPGGGTDFYDALQHAAAELQRQKARLGHILLLTDGDTNRSASEHEPVLAALERAGVTVTTIRIGDDTVNLEFLQSISQRTGGAFYHVRDARELPRLLLEDTSRALRQVPQGGEAFAVRLRAPSQALRGIAWEQAPPLSGYAFTQLKPGAEAWLDVATSGRTDPLLAAWNYGAGRVVAFTSLWNEGAEAWISWPASGPLWAQLLRWTMREASPRDVAVRLHHRHGAWEVTLASLAPEPPPEARGRLTIGERSEDLHFRLGADRQLVATVDPGPARFAELTVWLRSSGRSVEERRFALHFAPELAASPAEDTREPNHALLAALAAETGGQTEATPRQVAARPPGAHRQAEKSLEWILLPLSMLAFLGDVAILRLYPWRRR